ncbi:MAG: hypothetical protein JW807_00910 [Spirochaetes bacterium]|nr:hypothetical protein [Spirochaetota bacterium]
MGTTNPVITSMDDSGKVVHIRFIDGKNYKLQHPGNRIYLNWQRDFLSMAEGIDQAKFLDKAFEYCVIPDGHDFKPTIETVKPKELGVWQRLLRRFLDGSLDDVGEEKDTNVGRPARGSGSKD